MSPLPQLSPELADEFAALALRGVMREWPHSYQHVANGAADVRRPSELHPAFYGCYDWHSAVHGHWTLARVRRLFPRGRRVPEIAAVMGAHLNPLAMVGELAYFKAPGRAGFERPYGWSWLLALAAELRRGRDRASRCWARALRPLERHVAAEFAAWLSQLGYPVRTGVHGNTAFALTLALDYAREVGDAALAQGIEQHSRNYFADDVGAPAAWEPGGTDFLSPTLAEADLMRRVLGRREFARWWRKFLPELPTSLATPVAAGDHADPGAVHLHGLNLSRAWALRGIAVALPGRAPEKSGLLQAADAHAAAGLAQVVSGNYLGEHWLASFALYLLS
jgi:hypothetical protein